MIVIFEKRILNQFTLLLIGLLVIVCFTSSCILSVGKCRTINPLQFGLNDAETGEERYYILQRTHKEACEIGARVSYAGIKRIELTIPDDAKSIPLTWQTDFAGVELVVLNKKKNLTLFSMERTAKEIIISKQSVCRGKFWGIKELRCGHKLLIIEDKIPWVKNRKGHNYGAIRRDILFLKHGKAQNESIQPYSTDVSAPVTKYYDIDNNKKIIENLHFIRDSKSQYITKLVSITGENNVTICNIIIDTPPSEMSGDRIIVINNSANVLMKDISINGTYSQVDKYGYGISMDNVWNTRFIRIKARANWGVFGNNNINTVMIDDSDINRFDIHCYGKDVYCKNTIFRDLYNQLSSFYGTLQFEGCSFQGFVPVLFEPSYAAYTHFELVFKDCAINVDSRRPYLVMAGRIEISEDAREEINEVKWPNVKMSNVVISADKPVKDYSIFYVSGNSVDSVGGIDYIEMNNISFKGNIRQWLFSNKRVNTTNNIKINIKSSEISKLIIK